MHNPRHNPTTISGPLAAPPFVTRQAIIGALLVVALLGFEIFNFDTTKFALDNLLGSHAFFNITWGTILALAFCAIDFAGLAHLFTPDRIDEEPREVYFLMGAWVLGAAMNAIMTWWAVTLTLLEQPLTGNAVLSQADLLRVVPIFVAVLVWLTRILFIGAVSVAGDHLYRQQRAAASTRPRSRPMPPPRPRPVHRAPEPAPAWEAPRHDTPFDETPRQERPRRESPPTAPNGPQRTPYRPPVRPPVGSPPLAIQTKGRERR